MIPFKYRLVTDEAKCGSMGRTRHLLWEHQGQEIGSRGGQDPMAKQGCRGPCTCTLVAPAAHLATVLWPCAFLERLNPGNLGSLLCGG